MDRNNLSDMKRSSIFFKEAMQLTPAFIGKKMLYFYFLVSEVSEVVDITKKQLTKG